MIYLITGVPGSGKTLYAVSTLIQKLAAEKTKDKDGKDIQRRVCVDGIPNLIFPHEMMAVAAEDDTVETARGRASTPTEREGNGIWNWFEWCQPGDVIVIDEVQRYWRPRGMGVKPPKEIQMLETHRHLGVDFVIITQSPMLIDQNVRRLVGRHQHVRRLFGMKRAVIYEWDGCAADVARTANATQSFFQYPKNAFKLYKSAELHTKQSFKVPLWVVVPVLAVVGLVVVGPKLYGVMSSSMSGKGLGVAAAKTEPQPKTTTTTTTTIIPASIAAPAPIYSASSPVAMAVESVKFSGCFKFANKCGCMGEDGAPVKTEPGVCEAHILGNATPGSKVNLSQLDDGAMPGRNPDDDEVLAFMEKNSKRFQY